MLVLVWSVTRLSLLCVLSEETICMPLVSGHSQLQSLFHPLLSKIYVTNFASVHIYMILFTIRVRLLSVLDFQEQTMPCAVQEFCTRTILLTVLHWTIFPNCDSNVLLKLWKAKYTFCRWQWPHGLIHELPSLGSWAQIPVKTWMSLCVGKCLATDWSPVQGVLPTM
jgi:hypothetical protein